MKMEIGQYWMAKNEPTIAEIKSLDDANCVKFKIIGIDVSKASETYLKSFLNEQIISEPTEKFMTNFNRAEREK
jgi:hypothetical protein